MDGCLPSSTTHLYTGHHGSGHKRSMFYHRMTSKAQQQHSVPLETHIYHDLSANQRNLLVPLEIYLKIAHLAEDYAASSDMNTFLLSIMGGTFVSLGAATAFMVAGTLNEAPYNPDTSLVNYGMYKLIYGAFGYPFAFTSKLRFQFFPLPHPLVTRVLFLLLFSHYHDGYQFVHQYLSILLRWYA
jgi:hypothetical protein